MASGAVGGASLKKQFSKSKDVVLPQLKDSGVYVCACVPCSSLNYYVVNVSGWTAFTVDLAGWSSSSPPVPNYYHMIAT